MTPDKSKKRIISSVNYFAVKIIYSTFVAVETKENINTIYNKMKTQKNGVADDGVGIYHAFYFFKGNLSSSCGTYRKRLLCAKIKHGGIRYPS